MRVRVLLFLCTVICVFKVAVTPYTRNIFRTFGLQHSHALYAYQNSDCSVSLTPKRDPGIINFSITDTELVRQFIEQTFFTTVGLLRSLLTSKNITHASAPALALWALSTYILRRCGRHCCSFSPVITKCNSKRYNSLLSTIFLNPLGSLHKSNISYDRPCINR